MTKMIVWSRSDRLNASIDISKHSCTDEGSSMTCRVSPWELSATKSRSPCAVRVGSPVDGPTRWMSNTTAGISA